LCQHAPGAHVVRVHAAAKAATMPAAEAKSAKSPTPVASRRPSM